MIHVALPFSKQCKCVIALTVLALALLIASSPATAALIFTEDFEDGVFGPNMSATRVGGFISNPGIKDVTSFGSTKAYGFGISDCPGGCFDNHLTSLSIHLGAPTLVSSISFKELERSGNFGSGGAIFVDGALFGTTHEDFGRLPYNDRIADQAFRFHTFSLNRTATTIELRVRDISNQSEIVLDDIAINGTLTPVPLPNSGILLLAGAAVLGLIGAAQANFLQRRVRA